MKIKLVLPVLAAALLLASCNLFASRQEVPQPGGEPPAVASDTLAISLTPSGTPPPTSTYTPDMVSISVSMDTNCRIGPGEVYDWVGGLMTGDSVQVYATDPTGRYWYIANPHGAGYCWVWGQYATLVGNPGVLPVYTPPPTPTPVIDFELHFQALDRCMAMRYTRLKLVNIGVIPWESFKATVTDLSTSDVSSPMASDEFTDATSCGTTTSVAVLNPGETAIVYTYGLDHDLTGHSLRADVTVCAQNGLLGTCVTHALSFTP